MIESGFPRTTENSWTLPSGIRELEPFDGALMEHVNKEFQMGRTYLLGHVEPGTGGLRPLVIYPAPEELARCFEDGCYTCTFVNASFTILEVSTWHSPAFPIPMPDTWVTKARIHDALKANKKVKRDACTGRVGR